MNKKIDRTEDPVFVIECLRESLNIVLKEKQNRKQYIRHRRYLWDSNVFRKSVRDWEMAQWMKPLLCQPQDGSSDP